MTVAFKTPPSARWKSFEGWDYNGMKQRLEQFMSTIHKAALLEHVERVSGKAATMSEPFSAGQYWCCFEFVLDDHSLIIARARLPRHPDSNENTTDASELYAIQCEVATMKFLQSNVTTIPAPKLYAYEPPGSQQAVEVGACYMLIEGFYGNTLQDVKFDICDLPVNTQEHIIARWTSIQAELATFSFAQIGSISHFPTDGQDVPTIGPLAAAVAENFSSGGPFATSQQYFAAVGEARYTSARKDISEAGELGESDRFCVLGAFIFCDIVFNTELFKDRMSSFHLNHMDMGTQNILVDDDFNFLAIIDWEFAQTAPVQVNHFPKILQDPDHIAFRNVSRQTAAQKLYQQKFQDAEQSLARKGRPVIPSIADGLQGPASRIYAILEKLGGSGEPLRSLHMRSYGSLLDLKARRRGGEEICRRDGDEDGWDERLVWWM
ncbi:hypothetical protein BU24DRAFT_442411 [Aaosphaeria arxii CBS 175.79]|uniref:Uncharacterized protein n=1 Tax=Aaosphaeria arxii CBS 175.79 TaxID=1450172 RepID=A0A6A5XJG2_9PLEO|nr:uncharacterized protein BU24DRAFT_442411 [Aaosphaeria arxii CBS 175.79]KAF2013272.1 hypothetical protein BU24DRAFT_442411 [Aaosphaeria arxii CBS 175.79]